MDASEPKIVCESCDPPEKDHCCIGVLNHCKVVVKPMVYDHMPIVIIVTPLEHNPYWKLSPEAASNLHKTASTVASIFYDKFDLFPNFFTGGNINNAKYGLPGVHAHIHIEARSRSDPDYNTFPTHKNKRMLTKDEIESFKAEWRTYLNL